MIRVIETKNNAISVIENFTGNQINELKICLTSTERHHKEEIIRLIQITTIKLIKEEIQKLMLHFITDNEVIMSNIKDTALNVIESGMKRYENNSKQIELSNKLLKNEIKMIHTEMVEAHKSNEETENRSKIMKENRALEKVGEVKEITKLREYVHKLQSTLQKKEMPVAYIVIHRVENSTKSTTSKNTFINTIDMDLVKINDVRGIVTNNKNDESTQNNDKNEVVDKIKIEYENDENDTKNRPHFAPNDDSSHDLMSDAEEDILEDMNVGKVNETAYVEIINNENSEQIKMNDSGNELTEEEIKNKV